MNEFAFQIQWRREERRAARPPHAEPGTGPPPDPGGGRRVSPPGGRGEAIARMRTKRATDPRNQPAASGRPGSYTATYGSPGCPVYERVGTPGICGFSRLPPPTSRGRRAGCCVQSGPAKLARRCGAGRAHPRCDAVLIAGPKYAATPLELDSTPAILINSTAGVRQQAADPESALNPTLRRRSQLEWWARKPTVNTRSESENRFEHSSCKWHPLNIVLPLRQSDPSGSTQCE